MKGNKRVSKTLLYMFDLYLYMPTDKKCARQIARFEANK